MSRVLHSLIIEDSENDTLLLVRELRQGGYEPAYARVETREAMHRKLQEKNWDIIFADFTMPRFNAFEALSLMHEMNLDLPFIVVSGTIGEDRAVLAMKAGAHDYILKDNMKRLLPAVERELREARIRRERKQAEQTIRHMAFYDTITDLPNRTLFRNETQLAIQSGIRNKHPVAVLLMDLERFKEVNDTLGHQRGDLLLQQVGARVRQAMFASDMVSRLGGDEFGILLPRLAAVGDIDIVARKIHDTLEAPFVIDGVPIVVEASLGAVIAPQHGNDADALLQHADVAMYHAKETGASFSLYDPGRDPHNPKRLALMGELRQAIEQDRLTLHYQPKIELSTGAVIATEALVRWPRPQNGGVLPEQFIRPAENTGLIKPLTHWVMNRALSQCREDLATGRLRHIAVNVSARSLHDLRFPDLVARLLREHGVAPEQLLLEITESALMLDLQRTIETTAVLSHMGVRISVDDFGAGFSSLNYIKKLPLREIKIDRSFVTDMNTDESDLTIVRSVIDLGHNLGLNVVAEGIESKEILDNLRRLNCDLGQGYYIARPMPYPDLLDWLKQKTPEI